ncbi:DUF6985 domain-containing protein [Mucilaginibacter galii]|uniref:DUF6985 domain-containing protein n=1 Tax=Mucilaginibacter galii TaxID=2005073 RepID=A0A917JC36_9SPHI|nr:hypothetical protein [Mucilaginibacter galii]GGI51720.1 hypothetical protein GCM10011425_29320 [Mucilaginibacter galii]
MNGWELEKPNNDILLNKKERIKAYALQNPLAGTDKESNVLVIIRRYHPSLNCNPDDPNHQLNTYRMCMAYYDATSYLYFNLPLGLDYTGVDVEVDENTGKPVFTIKAREMTRKTNMWELQQQLNSFTPIDEAAKMAAFERLENAVNTFKLKPITATEVESAVIGALNQSKQFEDWWESAPVVIPYLDGQELEFIYLDLNPAEDEAFTAEADEAISKFMALSEVDRLAASEHVYKNCMEYLEMIGYNEEDELLWNIKDPKEIWNYVRYNKLYVSREPYEEHQLYILLSCECDWEIEHGLQLVFNKTGKLIRVSAEDGHILGYMGDGMIG